MSDITIAYSKIEGGIRFYDAADLVDSPPIVGTAEDGRSPVVTIAEVVTGAPGSDALVEDTDSGPDVALRFVIPAGNDGADPEPATDGYSPAVTIAEVITGAPGSQATVEDISDGPDVALRIIIPAGQPGASSGAGGGEPADLSFYDPDDGSITAKRIRLPASDPLLHGEINVRPDPNGQNGSEALYFVGAKAGEPVYFGDPNKAMGAVKGENSDGLTGWKNVESDRVRVGGVGNYMTFGESGSVAVYRSGKTIHFTNFSSGRATISFNVRVDGKGDISVLSLDETGNAIFTGKVLAANVPQRVVVADLDAMAAYDTSDSESDVIFMVVDAGGTPHQQHTYWRELDAIFPN
ncbi:hypothetical protein [Neolewinella antarctica]|uniref:Uncharacterized protein n=1 Tax=Neolewinella antarctica TaxID=442734 RepID=A0ABX0X7L2_9BACT|nr:hypothetical protein [Neolewinella antarctica]NJC24812.1 hypothetical protein [Neolewinella antarctica]